MSYIKQCVIYYYNLNYYTIDMMRNVTREEGGKKKFSYDEFYEIIGITVDYYDTNVDAFKDMKHDDMVKWLQDNPDWNKAE